MAATKTARRPAAAAKTMKMAKGGAGAKRKATTKGRTSTAGG